jgi:O-acetylhomoserine (thiol)-lyase
VAALATASGAAAITYTIQALAQAGDHIVAQKTIYGGSYNLLAHTLPQYGIRTTFVDAHDLFPAVRRLDLHPAVMADGQIEL